MKISVLLPAVLMALVLAPGSGSGRIWWSGNSSVGSYQLEVLVDGVARPTYYFSGNEYVEGRIGERYLIRVHNHSSRRVEAVISVDGRDVIDGRESSLNRRGYVIAPYSYVDIDGFRINMNEVAAFRFTTVPDSYSARMGTPWKVGIIGVAVFPERVYRPEPPPPPYVLDEERDYRMGGAEKRADGAASEAAPQPSRSRNIGTEFGERRSSAVSETRFERESWSGPEARLSLRYDSREGLCTIGVAAFCYPPYYPPWPPPYEPQPPNRSFSQPPPGWEHFSSWY